MNHPMMGSSNQEEEDVAVGKQEDDTQKRPRCSRRLRRRRRVLGISDLSDNLIGEVFKFIGRGHFLFVAGTSNQFYCVYQTICGNENDSAVTTTTMASAVESISRLQWARANGCPWNRHTCSGATKNGHLEVLQWARDNGCSWDELLLL